MKALSADELSRVEGGTTNPSYHLSDNYDGITYSCAFFCGFICGFLGLR